MDTILGFLDSFTPKSKEEIFRRWVIALLLIIFLALEKIGTTSETYELLANIIAVIVLVIIGVQALGFDLLRKRRKK